MCVKTKERFLHVGEERGSNVSALDAGARGAEG